MRRFRLLFLVFALALLAPLAFLVQRALRSVALETQMQYQTVAERVFDEMERALSRLLEREEGQRFDGYGVDAQTPAWPFVVGRFRIDPDGTVQALSPRRDPAAADAVERAVRTYWRSGGAANEVLSVAEVEQVPGTTVDLAAGLHAAAAPSARPDEAKAKDVSAFDALRSLNKGAMEREERLAEPPYASLSANEPARGATDDKRQAGRGRDSEGFAAGGARQRLADAALDPHELPSMTGRVIDGDQLMLYRTVVRQGQGYRQGVLIDLTRLGDWLREQGLGDDGLARYAQVMFAPLRAEAGSDPLPAGATGSYRFQHRFAEPFDDISARLALRELPGVSSVTYVYALAALLLITGVLGLAALYRMVSVVVSFAERRSNFVAAVSHELKTPLTAIRMYGEMLRDGLVASEAKRDEYHRHITVEAERLSRLINNVLDFGRLEKGTRDMALETGSVAPVLREVAALVRPHVEGQGFELGLDIDEDLPPACFERDALLQMLWNLVDNAVKYARESSPQRIVLRCVRDGGAVRVAVRDHGPGVPARQLGKIFEPFYRGENELTRRNKGTGLGLALVRGLAERMGATVDGSNAPDGGFEVAITLRPA
jgi:signal transduction histidine kinase